MKLGRKLILSGAALAACATTLVSTSYAWYVSNSNAAVENFTGATGGTSVSGNLLVSHDSNNAPKAYGQTISFTKAGSTEGTIVDDGAITRPTNGLWPVTYNADKTGFIGNTDGDDEDALADASNDYYTIKFWIYSSDSTDIKMSLKVTNTTTEFKKQTLYNEAGKPDSVNILTDFYKDAVTALHMDYTLTPYTVETDGSLKAGTATTAKRFSVAEVAGYTPVTGSALKGDANAYYKAVMGKDPLGGQTYTTEEAAFDNASFETLTLTKATDTLVTIRIWLDGRDSDCFDSCVGQSFDFDFAFEAKAATTTTTTTTA